MQKLSQFRSGTSQKSKKRLWVKVIWVIRVTGWRKRELWEAREDQLITWRQDAGKAIEYDLYSIPEVFIKRSKTTQEMAITNNN